MYVKEETWKRVTCAIGIWVGVAALLSHAVEYAQLTLAMADLSRGRLYDHMEPDGIILGRKLVDWALAWTNWIWLVWGGVVAILAVTRSTQSKAVWTIGLGITVGWTVLGVWYGFHGVKIEQVGADLMLNVVGGLIGSAIFFLAIVTEAVIRKRPQRLARQHNVWYNFGVVGGVYCLVIMLTMYYVVGVFVQTRKADVRVAAKPPMQVISAKRETKNTDTPVEKVSDKGNTEEVKVSYGKDLHWVWQVDDAQPGGTVTVAAVGGCINAKDAREVVQRVESIPTRKTRRVELVMKTFRPNLSVRGEQSGVRVEGKELKIQWINEGDENENRSLTELLDGKHDLIARTSGELELYSNSLMIQAGEQQNVARSEVIWHVVLDDVAYQFRVPPRDLKSEGELEEECRVVGIRHKEKMLTTEEVFLSGLYIKIDPVEVRIWDAVKMAGMWRLYKPAGWVDFGNLDQQNLDGMLRREVEAVWLQDGVEDVYVDWEKVEVPLEARFRGHGDAVIWYSREGRVITEGLFHASWLGTRRINQTTWEGLGIELKLTLATGVMSGLCAVVAVLYRQRKNWIEGWNAPLMTNQPKRRM